MAVKKHKTVKPPTDEDILVAKFHACSGVPKYKLYNWIQPEKLNKSYSSFDFKKFEERLRLYNMEEYKYLLYNFMCTNFEFDQKRSVANISIQETLKKKQVVENEIVDVLMCLLSGEDVTSLLIKKNVGGSISVKNNRVLNSALGGIKTALFDLINKRDLTPKEAEIAIQNNEDVDWVKEWKESLEYVDSEENRIEFDEFQDDVKYLDLFTGEYHVKEYVLEQMQKQYAVSHQKTEPNDIELLNKFIASKSYFKSKGGRTEETTKQKYYANALSNLVRLKRYLERKDVDDILKIPVENQDCRFIHDVLVFFKVLLVDYSVNKKLRKILEKRIRKILSDMHETNFNTTLRLNIYYLKEELFAKK